MSSPAIRQTRALKARDIATYTINMCLAVVAAFGEHILQAAYFGPVWATSQKVLAESPKWPRGTTITSTAIVTATGAELGLGTNSKRDPQTVDLLLNVIF